MHMHDVIYGRSGPQISVFKNNLCFFPKYFFDVIPFKQFENALLRIRCIADDDQRLLDLHSKEFLVDDFWLPNETELDRAQLEQKFLDKLQT